MVWATFGQLLHLGLEEIFRAQAKKNLVNSGKDYGKGLQNSANPIEPINTREELSKLAGVSHEKSSYLQNKLDLNH